MDIPVMNGTLARCLDCLQPTAENSERCEHCGTEIEPAARETLVGKIKRALGIEISSDIITIDLEDIGYFFSKQEIDFLLRFENLTVLDLEDVPDHDKIFYKSKTIRKPLGKT
jgi:hypothetical protein